MIDYHITIAINHAQQIDLMGLVEMGDRFEIVETIYIKSLR